MSKYLFLFTISPVQSFISQARKTHDLWAGSQILSDLMKEAHRFLVNNKCKIIYPQLISPDATATHRLLSIVSDTNLCGELEKAVKENFIKKAKSISIINDNFSACEDQLKDFLQLFWVATKVDENSYDRSKYKEIENLLGSVKNVRSFNQLVETGRKCGICGERNVKFYRKNTEEQKNKTNDELKAKKLFLNELTIIDNENYKIAEKKHFNSGEGLCAVCTLKRFYNPTNEDFSSTAEIALLESVNRLKKADVALKEYINFRDLIKNENYDDQLFYEENHTLEYLRKNNIKISLNDLKNKYSILKDKAKKNKIDFTKYYAVLSFDGDSMGKLMSGDYFNNEKIELKEYQIEISKLLSEFATWAYNSLDKNKVKTIYTGGDDFLGFVNLHHLFDVLIQLRENFDNRVNKKISDKFNIPKAITFTAGICIAHYKEPLSLVLGKTKEMEHKAKHIFEEDGKNAFGLAVIKGSGEIAETFWKNNCIDILQTITFSLKNEEFSNTFIKALNNEFERLLNNEGKINDKNLIESEIKRLVKRACQIKRNENEKVDDFKEKKLEKINELSDKINELLLNTENIRNLFSALNICDFIQRKK